MVCLLNNKREFCEGICGFKGVRKEYQYKLCPVYRYMKNIEKYMKNYEI